MPPYARLLTLVLPLGALACTQQTPGAQESAPPAIPATAAPTAASMQGAGSLTDPASGAQCGGKDVRITRDDFQLVLEGDCGEIVITGSNGSLNVDKARAIRVEGSHVTVLNSKADALTVTGSSNTLNMTEVAEAVVEGDDNGLLGQHYGKVVFRGQGNYVNTDNQPQLEDTGSGNKVI